MRFTKEKHKTLTHRVPYLHRTIQCDLFDDGSNMTAEIVVNKLLPIMEGIRDAADQVGD